MRSRDQTVKKNKPTQSGVILLVTGISIMLLGVAADSLHIGRPSFGQTQLSVVIVGGIVTLSGLRKLIFPSQAKLDGVLVAAYFLGLLFMGIEPKSFKVSTNKYFLHVGAVSLNKDFLINVLGFLPFGYLVMSYLLDNYRLKKMRAVALAVLFGTSISLIFEMIQYVIPGRVSSLSDWILNSIGTFLGVCFYLLAAR
jgi:hypothetical protein